MVDTHRDTVELQRSRFQEEIDEVCDILKESSIPYKLGSDGAIYDITQVGVGGDPQTIISVYHSQFGEAREAMGVFYLRTPLPEDHYLHTFSDQELSDLLGSESEWSAYDVAHARKIAADKGVDAKTVESSKQEYEAKIADGKPASGWLCWLPICLSVLWGALVLLSGSSGLGVLGVAFPITFLGISWSIMTMRAKHPYRRFHLYNVRSRESARTVLSINLVVLAVVLISMFSRSLRF